MSTERINTTLSILKRFIKPELLLDNPIVLAGDLATSLVITTPNDVINILRNVRRYIARLISPAKANPRLREAKRIRKRNPIASTPKNERARTEPRITFPLDLMLEVKDFKCRRGEIFIKNWKIL